MISYNYQGLQADEVKDYVRDRMKLCGVHQPIFSENALEAASGCCGGSIRKLNTLAHRALMIGCERQEKEISPDTIMDAAAENDLL